MIHQGFKAEWHLLDKEGVKVLSIFREPNSANSTFVFGNQTTNFDIEQLRELAATILKAADYSFPDAYVSAGAGPARDNAAIVTLNRFVSEHEERVKQ